MQIKCAREWVNQNSFVFELILLCVRRVSKLDNNVEHHNSTKVYPIYILTNIVARARQANWPTNACASI